MSAPPQIEFAYPVAWPAGRPRTPSYRRKQAMWREGGSRINWDIALRRLREQVALVTRNSQDWRILEQTLSTNFELRVDGRPRRDRGAPADPGVAFFFELDGQPHVLACDLWDTVPDNIAAIAAHIEALRGQERWGVSDMKQAFAGHVALPAPEQWHQVLGVPAHASPEDIDRAWREKMQAAHPDRPGGSEAAAQRLNWARTEGKRQWTSR
ncbi:J domain-containing protein [Alteraurantiacibacter palmitatis]|uniref:J domain-containing protein n=1 Tax=Alteraurantiacibacter palmitatis TaxID=2054628 RepID=A0ABV7E6U4_9SPHN